MTIKSVYPSPAKDTLHINLGILKDTKYSFSLLDMQGKVVLEKPIENAILIESISLSGISKGMYLAVLQTNTKRITKKIIVE